MINFLASFLELKTLDLSNNHIKIVRENDFLTTFESLESLNLNRNQISTLEYGLFGQLKALKVLKFSRTFLSYINLTEIFIQMPEQLNEIDMGHNKIHFEKDISSSPSLQKIKSFYRK